MDVGRPRRAGAPVCATSQAVSLGTQYCGPQGWWEFRRQSRQSPGTRPDGRDLGRRQVLQFERAHGSRSAPTCSPLVSVAPARTGPRLRLRAGVGRRLRCNPPAARPPSVQKNFTTKLVGRPEAVGARPAAVETGESLARRSVQSSESLPSVATSSFERRSAADSASSSSTRSLFPAQHCIAR
jgi:hypothetical protein